VRRALAVTLAVVAGLAIITAAAAASPPAPLSAEARDRFLTALGAFRAGSWSAAAVQFADASWGSTPLAEYALFFQAESLARLGEAAGARAAASRAGMLAPDGPLAPQALALAAEQAVRAGDDPGAAALYRRFLERHGERAEGPRVRYALGQALEASGQLAEAQGVFRGLWLTAPASAYAEAAAQQERALAERGLMVPPPTAREKLDRAERLLAAGLHVSARAAAEEVLAEEAPPAELALRALRVVSEGARRADDHDIAVLAIERAVSLTAAERRPSWLLGLARLQQRRSRDQALATLARVLRDHPKSREAPEALLLQAQLLEALPARAKAEAVYIRLATGYPEEAEAGAALWRLGWLSWLRGAHAEAASRWARILQIRGGQAYREAASYWVGRAREEQGDTALAERHFTQLLAEAPRSYYGVLAARRAARAPQSPPRPAVSLPAEPLSLLAADVQYAKVEALRAVMLAEFADAELEEMVRRSNGEPARLYALSAAYAQASRFHLALRILRRHFVALARNGHPSLPRAFWEMLYPVGWRAELKEAADRASLDPLLVAAVVREESSYYPQARSRVGARGLMQLMPDTARPMARHRGLAFNDGELLDEPGPNLEMGAAFLSGLLKQFGDARLAVAAYNAGPTRVREWWAARRSGDLEAFIEQIPFDETRAFVKRVMLSWDEYRRIYGSVP
jgi:soluble lytic murein transglycosylase